MYPTNQKLPQKTWFRDFSWIGHTQPQPNTFCPSDNMCAPQFLQRSLCGHGDSPLESRSGRKIIWNRAWNIKSEFFILKKSKFWTELTLRGDSSLVFQIRPITLFDGNFSVKKETDNFWQKSGKSVFLVRFDYEDFPPKMDDFWIFGWNLTSPN